METINLTYVGEANITKGLAFAEKLVLEGFDVTTDIEKNLGPNVLSLRATRPFAEQRQPHPHTEERPSLLQG